MIDRFENFDATLNENNKSALRKLFSFMEKDHEVRVAIEKAISQAGNDVIQAFLYDLSNDSTLKDYNNSKNRARGIISKEKKSEAIKAARDAKMELIAKEKEKREKVEKVLSKKLGADNYRLLNKKIPREDLYMIHDLIQTKRTGATTLSADKIEIIKNLSKFDVKDEDINNVINIIQKK